MKKVPFFLIAFTIASSIVPLHICFAAIFKYVDDHGIVCFCNNFYVIPEKYRKDAVIVKGASERANKQSPDQKVDEANITVRSPDKREAEINKEKVKDVVRIVHKGKLLYTIVVFTGALAIFIAIGKIANSMNQKRVGSLLRVVLAAGVVFYIYNAYAQEIATMCALAKNELTGAQNLSDQTRNNAEDAAKGLSENQSRLK